MYIDKYRYADKNIDEAINNNNNAILIRTVITINSKMYLYR